MRVVPKSKLPALATACLWLLTGPTGRALALQPGQVPGEHLPPLTAPAATISPVRPADRDWVRAIEQNDAQRLGVLFAQRQAAGLTTHVRNQKGKTALMAAAAAGDLRVFRQLIAGGADPGAVNVKGASTLMYAAWRGNPQVIADLLARGVALDQSASNGWTAMTMAAAKGHAAVVRLLVDAGARVDTRDVYAWTPLMRASDLGRLEVVQVLTRPGVADLGLVNTSGQTALHLAAAAGHQAVYKWLMDAGADPRIADFQGRTPAQISSAWP